MEKNLKNQAVVGLCALGLVGLNSCLKVDDTYDLDKDFDMTITVGGDLTVPGSSTEKTKLGELLDLEEDGVIRVNEETGNYSLVQEGESNTTNVEVPEVEITPKNNDEFTPVEVSVNINSGTDGSNGEATISFTDNIVININKDDVSSDITDISSVVTSEDDTYSLIFTKSGTIEYDAVINNGYTIEFPDYITVESKEQGWKAEGNKLILNQTNGQEITNETEIKFRLSNISFNDYDNGSKFEYGTKGNNDSKISLKGDIELKGNITASARTGGSGDIKLTANISFNKMKFKSVTGKIDPEVKIEIEPIYINDLPDFLAENDVVLDIVDPRIYITLTNNSPVSVDMSADLVSWKNGTELANATLDNVNVPADCDNYVVCLNQIKDEWNESEKIEYVKVNNMSNLIKNIPDKIEIANINTEVVDEEITAAPGSDYKIITDYKVDTELKFGTETEINYNEVIDGWQADLDGIKFNTVKASMNVTNAIPLGINLTATAIDDQGNALSDVTVNFGENNSGVNIEAGSVDNPTTQLVEFTLTAENGTIENLDGLSIKVQANSKNNTGNESLNKEQYMQFTDIKLGLVGGITMDLN